jgi:hypothetical protein
MCWKSSIRKSRGCDCPHGVDTAEAGSTQPTVYPSSERSPDIDAAGIFRERFQKLLALNLNCDSPPQCDRVRTEPEALEKGGRPGCYRVKLCAGT